MPIASEDIPRFICDDNLGKLARYLRVGGFDTKFENDIDNSRLIRISLDDKRYILTRDRRLIERRLVRYYFLIEHDLWPEQMKAVLQHFRLAYTRKNMFSRCLEDNTPIVPVEKETIRDLVYPYTFEHHDDFRQCPECRRVYWSGSHTGVILKNLQKAGILSNI
jgi:uncharacterized protein with PIN domain